MNTTKNKSYISINLLIVAFLFIAFSCDSYKKAIISFNERLKALQDTYIKDKSLSVIRAELDYNNGNWTLEGETTNSILFSKLISYTDSLLTKENYINKLMLLPDSTLGDSNFAIVNVSVTPLREKPRHSSQMVDQAILGNTIKLLRYSNGWYLAQTHYKYVGWINKTGLHVCDSTSKTNWERQTNYTTKTLQSSLFSQPSETSQPVSDMVLNNVFIGKIQNKNWVSLLLPDGRSGFAKMNLSLIHI